MTQQCKPSTATSNIADHVGSLAEIIRHNVDRQNENEELLAELRKARDILRPWANKLYFKT